MTVSSSVSGYICLLTLDDLFRRLGYFCEKNEIEVLIFFLWKVLSCMLGNKSYEIIINMDVEESR